MPDFSIIAQTPAVRAIVQEGMLERVFHDALFPSLQFRGEAVPQLWTAGVGDTLFFTAPGLITPDASPIVPGQDASVATYPLEQWMAQVQQYGKSIDTDMPTSMVAIANLFLRNGHQLGLHAGQSINRKVRDVMYNAAESGWTVADGAGSPQTSTTSLRVKRLNGFTRARNPTLASAGTAQVKFDQVSANNPLAITVFDSGSPTSFNVVGYTSDNPGDEIGPGVLTLSAAVTSVADRAYVKAIDRSDVVFVGGGNKVDDVTVSDTPTFDDVRSTVSNMRQNLVPRHPDGRYHAHCSPVSESRLYSTPEFQRINTSLPDYYMYRQFALGEFLGVVYYQNSECPIASTVVGGPTATFSLQDPFAPEVWNNGNASTGIELYRILFTGQGGVYEYYMDHDNLLTEAGITGKVGEPSVNNNGIEVSTDRIRMILRAPLDRLQQKVSSTWTLFADWPFRTDAATGDASRYKRAQVLIHA